MLTWFIKYVGKNFGNPRGIGGKIATLIMNVINQKQYNSLLQNINLESNDFVLDIGFGNGYLIDKLLKQNVPITICGIEISQDMLLQVSSKHKQKVEYGNLKLLLENITKTSFEQDFFDKIYTVNTIYFWHDLEKCFTEIKRILKPNGLFFNVIYTKEYLDKIVYTKHGFHKYSVDELKKITENNGIKIKELVEIKQNKSYCIISENV